MKVVSYSAFLAVLGTIARLTAAEEGCEEGYHLTNGACCPTGTIYYESPNNEHGMCCNEGEVYHHNTAGTDGTCCKPEYAYDEESNRCYEKSFSGGGTGPRKPNPPKKPEEPPPNPPIPPNPPVPSQAVDPCAQCPPECVNPHRPPPAGGSRLPPPDGNSQTPLGPGGVIPPGGGPGNLKIPRTPDGSCGCATGSPCFTPEDLGIQYGKCYNLIDTNGLPLGRDTGGVYQSGGDIQNLVFRICKSTDDCSADLGQPVAQHNGKFFLQDQQGWTSWQGPAWFGNNWPHFTVNRAKTAVQFSGEGMCVYGSPAICLRDGEKARGMAAPCPLGASAAMAHIYYTNNPNSCKAYRFIESTCLSNMVPEKN